MSRFLWFTVYKSSSSTSIFVWYAKHSKCDVIVNRCLRLKNQYFFNHDFLHSGTPLLHVPTYEVEQAVWFTAQLLLQKISFPLRLSG